MISPLVATIEATRRLSLSHLYILHVNTIKMSRETNMYTTNLALNLYNKTTTIVYICFRSMRLFADQNATIENRKTKMADGGHFMKIC